MTQDNIDGKKIFGYDSSYFIFIQNLDKDKSIFT